MVDCRATKERYRADQLFVFAYVFPAVNHKGEPTEAWLAGLGGTAGEAAELPEKKAAKLAKRFGQPAAPPSVIPYLQLDPNDREKVIGPSTDERGTLTEPRAFNLMFKTFVGALENESNVAYLRPETAQGIFANFKNVVDTGRVKIPFGIAQIGKSFRNEINPRNFTFRSREFEQMEIEFFCRPEEAKEWYAYWRKARFEWYVDLGLQSDRLRLRDHDADELAFYSTATADIEYAFPFGISELEGIAHRGDYDLGQHMKFSGKDLSYFDEDRKERFVPHVVEPSAGADRATLAFLCEAYTVDEVGGESRTVLKFHPRIAPIKAAVFPLVKRDGMPERAEAIYRELKRHYNVAYDEKGAIGRRYRRQDEAGTPFCITVDSQTLTDDTVTIRDRDTCRQWRVAKRGRVRGPGRPAGRSCACRRPALESGISQERIVGFWIDTMKPCISQATTLKNPFEADPADVFAQWLDRRRDLVDQARDVSAGSFARRGPTDAGIRRDQTRRGGVSGRLALVARRRARKPLEAL